MQIPKRFTAMAALCVLVLGVSACQDRAAEQPAESAENSATTAPVAEPTASAEPVEIKASTEELDFNYAWPSEASAIAPLDAWLRGHAGDQRKRMEAMAKDGAADARKNNYPARQYGFGQKWSVVADTPALLVLEAEGYEFTGGAHGMPFVSTLIWDKAKGARLPFAALVDVPALVRSERDEFCAKLDAERKERRGDAAQTIGDSVPEFGRCVDMAKQEIVPVSKEGKGIDLLRVEIMPYEAGPYAEGTYTIDLPVDAAVMPAVKPAWKSAFAPS